MVAVFLGLGGSAHAGAVLREVWTGISGGAVADLTGDPNYPDNPSSSNQIVDLLEAPINVGDNYGQRIRGYVRPPQSGLYTFWIASDDHSELWLSTNESVGGKVLIAHVDGWTNPREWDKTEEVNQQSSPVYLDTDRMYYLEILMAEGAGGDHVSVQWQRPDGTVEGPISCAHLAPPYGPFSAPAITGQSSNSIVTEGDEVMFHVTVSNLWPVAFQWYRADAPISGETGNAYQMERAALTDSNVQFYCVLTNALGVVTSQVETLHVNADITAPTLLSVMNVGSSQVQVVFSESVESNTACLIANYTLNNGISIVGASYGMSPSAILLQTTPLSIGATYRLTVSNVQDRAAASNTITMETYAEFEASAFALHDVGSPGAAGTISGSGTEVEITGGGSEIGGYADAFSLYYKMQTGDFDVKVQVENLDLCDPWAQAGIMAREHLTTNSRFAATLATPGPAGTFFKYRSTRNLLDNPDLEYSVADSQWWVWNDAEWKGDWGFQHSGTGMVIVYDWGGSQNGGVGQTISSIVPGETYTFSIWSKKDMDFTATEVYQLLRFKNSSHVEIGTFTNALVGEFDMSWVKHTVQATAPAGAAYLDAAIDVWGISGPGSVLRWDDGAVYPDTGYSGETHMEGYHPVNYPQTWLRLKREGDVFTGYASYDGSYWTPLSSKTIVMSNTLFLGMVVASQDAEASTTADFAGWEPVTGGSTGSIRTVNRREPAGPSSRRTGLAITEIMYHHPERADGKDLEFIELYNSDPAPVDIGGYILDGDVSSVFPEGTVIGAGGYLVIAQKDGDMRDVYGLTNVLDWGSEKLGNGGGDILLRNNDGALLLEISYDDEGSWPVPADGMGHSLVLARPSYGESDSRAWAASSRMWGTPGAADPVLANGYAGIVINEFLAHTDPPFSDFVELYNTRGESVDLSGCILSDDTDTNKCVLGGGTTIAADGYLALDTNALGFNLSSYGEMVILKDPTDSFVIDAVTFDGQENAISSGRYPDGGLHIQELAYSTPGSNNAPMRIHDIVINEIMYHPISNDDNDEYIELYNKGGGDIDVGGWRVRAGIDFTLPDDTVIPATGYLVIARSATNLIAKYPQLSTANTVGDYTGRLANGGERIELVRLDDPDDPEPSWIVVDVVEYGDGNRWGQWTDGDGSSLELVDPASDNRWADNWQGSDETAKADWTMISCTGVLDHGDGAIDELHVLRMGAGETLLDDVVVKLAGGGNRIANGTFNSGVSGWLIEGDHIRSTYDASAGYSGGALHIRASGSGDTGANRIETDLTSNFSASDNVVIEAKARWLAGHPGLLLRLRGNYLEASTMLTLPDNPGTPGLVNSRLVANAGPALNDVHHTPALPAAIEDALVTVDVVDPDGVDAVYLHYRTDPATSYTTVTMRDDGGGGDEVGSNGAYSAVIPGASAGALIAYYVEAVDAAAATNVFPQGAPSRECLVRFGDPYISGSLGAYRLWMTKENLDTWTNRPNLSNEPVEGTLVYNGRVIQNMAIRYRGSPWIRPGYDHPVGGLCAYIVEIPKDDRFLGSTKLNLDTLEPWRDNTMLRERVCFWMGRQAGLPVSHQRYVRLLFNGNERGYVYADSQHVSSEYIECWFPENEDGDIFKVNDWFEFPNDGDFVTKTAINATLEDFTTTGGDKKKARYRWNWQKKSNGGLDDSYEDLFALVDAMNQASVSARTERVRALIDVDEWNRVLALRHVAGDWDGYGYARGKNMFAYKNENDPWALLLWDMDFCLGAESRPYDIGLFDEINEPVISNKFLQAPAFRRSYFQAVKTYVDGPLFSTDINAYIDAYYEALVDNQVDVYPAADLKTWLSMRRNNLETQLSAVEAPFEITSNGGADFTTNRNGMVLSGSASLDVRMIQINGVSYTPEWTTLSNWQVRIALNAGVNVLTVTGLDATGAPVAGAADAISISCSAVVDAAQDAIVINEIMYNPTNANAEYLELYNRSANTAFDLYDWKVSGCGFTFDTSVIIEPQGYLVLSKEREAFVNAYGWSGLPVAEFDGTLDNAGETLKLIFLNGGGPEFLMDEVYYDTTAPWPLKENMAGVALQLIDVDEDNDRVGNWDISLSTKFTPGAVNATTDDLPAFPLLWLNEIQLSNTTGFADSQGEREPWVELFNASLNGQSMANFYLSDDYQALDKWAFDAASSVASSNFMMVVADGEPGESTVGEPHTGYRIAEDGSGSLALVYSNNNRLIIVDYLDYPALQADRSYGSSPDGNWKNRQTFYYASPGATNNNAAAPIQVYINEWMADNDNGLRDEFGEYDDWIEFYNAGATTVDLVGYTLTDDLAVPDKWTFTTNATIPAKGYLLVWADGSPAQNGGTNAPHADFKLSKDGEAIGLYAPNGSVADSLTFGAQVTDVSQGRYPDGNEGAFYTLIATPWAANEKENSPPTPNPIGTLNSYPLSTLYVYVSATDTEGNALSFVLEPGAPPLCSIQSASGLLAWRPLLADANTTNTVSVCITDDGTPALSATQSFDIVVSGADQLLSVDVGTYSEVGEYMELTWAARSGATYRVEYRDAVDDVSWVTLSGDVAATSAVATKVDNTIGALPRRYYRISERMP